MVYYCFVMPLLMHPRLQHSLLVWQWHHYKFVANLSVLQIMDIRFSDCLKLNSIAFITIFMHGTLIRG
jgi:hypothetical protein